MLVASFADALENSFLNPKLCSGVANESSEDAHSLRLLDTLPREMSSRLTKIG
jgi:hypothetical protein